LRSPRSGRACGRSARRATLDELTGSTLHDAPPRGIPRVSARRLQVFFKAGLHLEASDFSPLAIGMGAAFVATAVPLRIALVVVHRRFSLGERPRRAARVALSLVPTLVCTIVIADILRERYQVDGVIYGGLIVFTLINTMIPGFALRARPPEFIAPDVTPDEPPRPA